MPVSTETEARRGISSRRVLFLLSLAELLAMSLWFTGTAVIPQITNLWRSDLALGSWLTIAVQIGFSLGAITFALFNIPDVFSPIKVLVVSAVLAAAANAAFAWVAAQPLTAILLRGATGFFLAGVYPVGMKIIAGWFQRGRGLALGIMIGALAVGSIWAGAASDRLQDQATSMRVAQRARVTIIAMGASSVCCVLAALVLHRPLLLVPLAMIWGIAVIADSAQFSTIISEVSDRNYVGTALTCQVALGFLLTAFVIRLMAAIAARYGWNWALASMALGPLLGIWAMRGLIPRAQTTR